MDNNLTIKERFENQKDNLRIMEMYEDWEGPTQEFFSHWIEKVGGMDEWLGAVCITEESFDAWSHPVPTIETQFGNYTYDPTYQKWLDDDGLDERLGE